MWVQLDVWPQEVLQHTNRHFTLTVYLGMKSYAKLEICSEFLEELHLESAGEPWIPI